MNVLVHYLRCIQKQRQLSSREIPTGSKKRTTSKLLESVVQLNVHPTIFENLAERCFAMSRTAEEAVAFVESRSSSYCIGHERNPTSEYV